MNEKPFKGLRVLVPPVQTLLNNLMNGDSVFRWPEKEKARNETLFGVNETGLVGISFSLYQKNSDRSRPCLYSLVKKRR